MIVLLMDNGLLILLAGTGILVLVGVRLVRYVLLQGAKRTRELTAAAQEIGFQFEGDDWGDKQHAPELATALFRMGRGKRVRNIMRGSSSGFPASVFDYQFVSGHGENSRTHVQTVFGFRKNGIQLPEFEMHEETLLRKIADAFVHKDIDFESNPEFSRRYELRGAVGDEVRQLFSPSLLSFFEGLDARKKWAVEGAGETLIVYRPDVTVKPQELRQSVQETAEIASSFFNLCRAKSARA